MRYFALNSMLKKKVTRIDSPLVRYNELDQHVCRVCNIVLKFESLRDEHQTSRKHHVANAAGIGGSNGKSESLAGSKPVELHPKKLDTLAKSANSKTSFGLPPNFFDNIESAFKNPGQ